MSGWCLSLNVRAHRWHFAGDHLRFTITTCSGPNGRHEHRQTINCQHVRRGLADLVYHTKAHVEVLAASINDPALPGRPEETLDDLKEKFLRFSVLAKVLSTSARPEQ